MQVAFYNSFIRYHWYTSLTFLCRVRPVHHVALNFIFTVLANCLKKRRTRNVPGKGVKKPGHMRSEGRLGKVSILSVEIKKITFIKLERVSIYHGYNISI